MASHLPCQHWRQQCQQQSSLSLTYTASHVIDGAPYLCDILLAAPAINEGGDVLSVATAVDPNFPAAEHGKGVAVLYVIH